jgi:hypothetical protein
VTAALTFEFAVVDDDSGEVVAYLLPELPEDAPHDVLEGLARRRLTALDGRCPCGAVVEMPGRAARRRAARRGVPVRVVVEHENDCPAVDRVLGAALGRWMS